MTDAIRIGVCGAGAMGSGIAQVAAQAGHRVVVYDVFAPSRDRSQTQISKGLDQLVSRGKLDVDKAAAIFANMQWTDDVTALSDCGLVIEAIIEDLAVKQTLFAQLEEQMRDDAIIASNTSSLSIARLAGGLRRPERFIGMHFFNPATVMKLVEVVSGPATSPAVAEAVIATARNWGKVAVPVADVPGFIVNRVARPYYAEGFRCLQQGGASPELIDLLFRQAAGFRMGPLELTDLIGQDV
ncbi:MAG: 3-hydroxyacyl-CoA dehydrogenase family protein, partial [Novosphingobium sp.]